MEITKTRNCLLHGN